MVIISCFYAGLILPICVIFFQVIVGILPLLLWEGVIQGFIISTYTSCLVRFCWLIYLSFSFQVSVGCPPFRHSVLYVHRFQCHRTGSGVSRFSDKLIRLGFGDLGDGISLEIRIEFRGSWRWDISRDIAKTYTHLRSAIREQGPNDTNGNVVGLAGGFRGSVS